MTTPLDLTSCRYRHVFLELHGVGCEQRHATGFFWRHHNQIFLVTNWHVLSGLDMMTGASMSNGWCPERIIIHYFGGAIAGSVTKKSFETPSLQIALYEEFHKPHWKQHQQTFYASIDLAVIQVDKWLDGQRVLCVNDYNYPKLYHFAGSEIFVLGHPLRSQSSSYPVTFPIWKRGSIASELIVPWNMRPAFLIDSRTSRGMSGSPVFSRVFGPAAYGNGTIKTDNILVSEFMGVYSGRLFDDENNASLGLVWHRHLIDEIIASPADGSRSWTASPLDQVFRSSRKQHSLFNL